ncbi:MAG TPA: response regulator transcription factor [Candidatus Brocadiia bacterium]|nr:response regulator transcription factor [Candidatus Brocadiia bacterium]
MSIRVLIADDHCIMRGGLRGLISDEADMEVVGEADNGQAAIDLARETKPDIVIMDVTMPNLNGIQATRRIAAEIPGSKVLILSVHTDKEIVAEALAAGAAGYLLKNCAGDELVKAVRLVLSGKTYLSPDIAGVVVDNLVKRISGKETSAVSVLTPREREVLQLLADGNSTKTAAKMLGVSAKTIESHRKQIMDKLDMRSIAELTKFAIREGLTSVNA